MEWTLRIGTWWRAQTAAKGGVPFVGVVAIAALLSGGCAKFSPDAGMGVVQSAAAAEIGAEVVKIDFDEQAEHIRARTQALLAKPLTISAAVQVALLNNRALQAAYNDLGIVEAEMVEASLPPSPTVAFKRIVGSGGFEIERMIAQNVLALLTLPRRRDIAEARFRQAQVKAVEATLRTSAEAARAYYRAVATNDSLKFLNEARRSAETVSELAKRLGETGAMSKLDQAREHVFYAEVAGQVATARLRQRVERERLTRALGLWGSDTKFRLPDRLPTLPGSPRSMATVESEAIARRVDIVIAQMELEILAKELGLTRRTRFIDLLEARGVSTTDKDPPDKIKRKGFEFEVQIPIYDFGEARVRLAEETYMRAVNQLLDRAVNVRSEAREAYQGYRGAYDIARHYDREVLPLRQIISDETTLNYNAMIRDVFSLLADARARIMANVQAIEARRDFWLATVELHTAIVGGRGAVESEAPRNAGSGSSAEASGH